MLRCYDIITYMPNVGFTLGIVRVEWTREDFEALRRRFNGTALFRGPCLILDRQTGLALDAPDSKFGTKPILYTPHALPWQQWRLQSVGRGLIRIVSEQYKFVLTAGERPYDWSPLSLESPGEIGQTWRLRRSRDGAAFLIEHGQVPFALDTGQDATNDREPHLYSTHWESWQQWIICRLPIV